jgi:hypothetical protein
MPSSPTAAWRSSTSWLTKPPRGDLAADELRRAGFEVLSRDDHFVDDPDSEGIEWLIVARPAVKS